MCSPSLPWRPFRPPLSITTLPTQAAARGARKGIAARGNGRPRRGRDREGRPLEVLRAASARGAPYGAHDPRTVLRASHPAPNTSIVSNPCVFASTRLALLGQVLPVNIPGKLRRLVDQNVSFPRNSFPRAAATSATRGLGQTCHSLKRVRRRSFGVFLARAFLLSLDLVATAG